MTRLEKFTVFLIIMCCAAALVSQSLNQGIGLPSNGPCTPFTNQAGVCSDNGIPAMYGVDGVVVHLPVAGKDGIDGTNGKDAVFPQNVILTCSPSQGTVNKGFTAKCTVTVSQ